MSDTLDSLVADIDWPHEPWVCTPENADAVLQHLIAETDGNPGKLFEAMEALPLDARKLLWHLPAAKSLATLFQAEDFRRGLIFTLADTDTEFSDTSPGSDHDAWKRYFERIRFVVAVASRSKILSLQRLSMIAIVLDSVQKTSGTTTAGSPDNEQDQLL